LIKLLYIAVVVCLVFRIGLGRWPWDYLRLAPTRAQALLRARKLLSVRADASRTDILDAHKRLITLVHPDKGGSDSQVHEANAARDLLLDELADGH